MVTKETKDLFAGKYGKLPMPINEEVAKKCSEIFRELIIAPRTI